jgi:hypothetical protein
MNHKEKQYDDTSRASRFGCIFGWWALRQNCFRHASVRMGIMEVWQMTREDKLLVHLELVIFRDLPEGTSVTGKDMEYRIEKATQLQKIRAYYRSRYAIPLLLPDEREPIPSTTGLDMNNANVFILSDKVAWLEHKLRLLGDRVESL